MATDTVPNPWQFTGEAWDAEVELLYLRARYYQPETGRFITKDPWPGNVYSPVTIHPYQYVANRPSTSVDPTGLQGEDEEPLPKDWTYYVPVHPNYWLLQRRLQPRALAWAASLPWRLVPDNYCLPGDLGCWGGAAYGEFIETLNLYQLGYLYGPQAPWLPSARVAGLTRGEYDVTSWLVEQMNTNSRSPTGCTLRRYYPWPGAWIGWIQMVGGGAIWDLKVDFHSRGISRITLCGLDCDMDLAANIHYGYMGSSIGIPPRILHIGAGAAQLWDNVIERRLAGEPTGPVGPMWRFFDEEADAAAISMGMELYHSSSGRASRDEFCEALHRDARALHCDPVH